MQFTEIPHAAFSIRGLINLRGQIITIFDLRRALGLDTCQITSDSRNIILRTDSEVEEHVNEERILHNIGIDPVGFLVDRIADVVEVSVDQFVDVPANMKDTTKELISNVVELKKELLLILNVEKLLEVEM
jgi:purine-binding chemotaxis protein CheW